MKFRTEVNITPNAGFIDYRTDILALGSCFADEIGTRLENLKFRVAANPFGVIFNPVSIARVLKSAVVNEVAENLFIQRDGQWYHHDYHSEVNASTQLSLIQKITDTNALVRAKLLHGNLLILTFGTAWVYKHLQTNNIVANCHKVPQKQFSKELLDVEELKIMYTLLFEKLFEQNPGLKILLTVSPVRHVKDGIHENNLSKSVLHLLTHFLVNRFEQVTYFPAYELITDDLRDYRFYKADLIHPTDQAADYVFEKLSDACFSSQTKEGVAVQRALLQLKAHRVKTGINPENKMIQDKIEALENQFAALKLNQ